jgi:glycerol-3-phosphate dehydrogenase (NAD(P)+)
MSDTAPTIAVLGSGSWGTALAIQLARNGSRVLLWGIDTDCLAAIRATGENAEFLPGVKLPENVSAVDSLETAITQADHVLVVTPSHAFGDVIANCRPWLRPQAGVAWACKGFEPGSGRLLHDVARELLGPERRVAVVTGPSFAVEVARNLPTAVTVAGNNETFTEDIARALHGGSFRAYTSDDMVGAALGGAVKNVLAVATGICDGMQLGDNARAALITRGLAEMMRLGRAMNARPETLMGLAGMGDLVLTCTGDLSRNRRLGLALGRGQGVDEAVREIGQVVEGVQTAAEVHRLAGQYQVSMPISAQVYGIIHEGWSPTEGVSRLLAREQKAESES